MKMMRDDIDANVYQILCPHCYSICVEWGDVEYEDLYDIYIEHAYYECNICKTEWEIKSTFKAIIEEIFVPGYSVCFDSTDRYKRICPKCGERKADWKGANHEEVNGAHIEWSYYHCMKCKSEWRITSIFSVIKREMFGRVSYNRT